MFRYLRRARTATAVAAILDSYFGYTSLLLNGETAVAPFTQDASSNNLLVTTFGGVRNDTFSPFDAGNYSTQFNGTTDFLTLPTTATANLGTSNFTFETWVYADSTGAGSIRQIAFLDGFNNGYVGLSVQITAADQLGITLASNLTNNITAAWTTYNQWTHIAVVRNGSVFTAYVNGVSIGTYSNASAMPAWTINNIGCYNNAYYYFKGYISNLRLVSGTALYNGTFTPSSTPLTAVSGTVILACQAPQFKDNSTNNFAVTVSGTPKVQPKVPFNYTPVAASAFFNGTTDYLTTATSAAAYAFGSGSLTIEAWVFQATGASTGTIFSSVVSSDDGLIFNLNSTGTLAASGSTTGISTSVATVPRNQWVHVAVTRNASSVWNFWINGVDAGGSTTVARNFTGINGNIGSWLTNTPFPGYISNLRVVKGTAVYTGSFTPPTAALSVISGTSLLTLQNAGAANNISFLDASLNDLAISRVGIPTQGTFSPFSQDGWSNYFPGGSSNSLSFPAANVAMGLGQFCIEAYVNPLSLASTNTIIESRAYNTTGTGTWQLAIDITTGLLNLYSLQAVSIIIAGPAIQTGVWTHVAISRDSANVIRLFVNGVLVNSVVNAFNFSSVNALFVGYNSDSSNLSFNGYISNVRVVKGDPVYTASFTPSTAPLTAIPGTALLTCQSNRYLDNSVNALTCTALGTVSVQATSPFEPVAAWSALTNGGSMYFNGTTDYLTIPDALVLQFGANNFTAECWVYPTATPASGATILCKLASASSFGQFSIYFGASSIVKTVLSSNGTSFDIASGVGTIAATINTWNHVALVRSGNVFTLWVNGAVSGTVTSALALNTSPGVPFSVGASANGTGMFNGGYISNLRIVNGTSVYTGLSTPYAQLADSSVADPYFQYNSLLLHGEGSNGAQNNTILDSSSNALTIARTGTPTQGTFSPFGNSGWSNYFTGVTGTQISVADTGGVFDFGDDTTGNCVPCTIEGWFNISTYATRQAIVNHYTSAGSGWNVSVMTSGFLNVGFQGNSGNILGTTTVTLNTWHHFAISGSDYNYRVYLDGVLQGVQTAYSDFGVGTVLVIGQLASASPMSGYVSNLRMIRGTALYTKNFAVPTAPLTAVAGTVLLTCNSNSFKDNSTYNLAVTPAGGSQCVPVCPLTVSSSYSASVNGGSLYFPGSEAVSAAPSSLLNITGDFTIECWIYPQYASYPAYAGITGASSSGGSNWDLFLWNGSLRLEVAGTTAVNIYNTGVVLAPNSWHHVAATRNGNVFTLWLNGVQNATVTTSTTVGTQAFSTFVGHTGDTTNVQRFVGYISNFRFVKGTALYNSAFSVPTAPLTAVSGTAMLLNGTNSAVLDSTGKNLVTTLGTAQTSTAAVKYGSSSLAFSGAVGTYATIPSSLGYAMGTGDYTVECWIYPTAFPATWRIITRGDGNGSLIGDATGQLLYYYSGSSYIAIPAAGGVAVNTWSHVAVSRTSGVTRIFHNGVAKASVTESTAMGATDLTLGSYSGGSQNYAGYIDDFRITKGVSRYTNSFQVPSSPVAAISSTSLLLLGTNLGAQDATGKNDGISMGGTTSTAQKKFGSRSLYFGGSSSDAILYPANPTMAFGTGDFTVETWMYPQSVTNNGIIQISPTRYPANNTGLDLALVTGKVQVAVAGSVYTSVATITVGSWYHVAVQRKSGVTKLFINGVMDTGIGMLADVTNYTGQFCVVGGYYSSGYAFVGYLDDVRVTQGYARYGLAGFTLPTTALPDSSATDPYFNQVSLLLHADGTSYSAPAANNNVIVDSSYNALTVTRTGSPTQGTFSPFGNNGWSGLFNGSTDYLTTASSTGFAFSSNFTMEAWVFPTASGTSRIFSFPSNTDEFLLLPANTVNYWDGTTNFTTSLTVALNSWSHVAVCKVGTAVTVYVNGVAGATGTSTYSTTASRALVIGRFGSSSTNFFSGYISNARIVNGTAVYTTAFTPTTAPLTAVAGGTSLLTLQSNRFKDNSGNNLALTVAGTPSVQANSPLAVSAYDPAVNGGSMCFPATTDSVSITTGLDNFAFGTGNFTIEAWVYQTSASLNVVMPSAGTNTWGFLTYLNGFYWQEGGANIYSAGSVPSNQWVHLAVSRSNGVLYRFINGVLIDFNNNTYNHTALTNRIVGSSGTGYVSNVRVIKGTALYTAAFTPPTAPLAVTGNTAWLLNGVGAGIVDGTGKNDVITVSGAAIQSSVVKYGTGAISFNGTNDFLRLQTGQPHLSVGTLDFTIEAWVYPTKQSGTQAIYGSQADGTTAAGSSFCCYISATTATCDVYIGATPYVATSPNPPANQWSHVAYVRSGNTWKTYLNGSLVGSTGLPASASINAGATTYAPAIGAINAGGNLFQGYISDFRFTKGVARYTGAFTPPAAALPNASDADSYFNQVSVLLNTNVQNVTRTVAKNNVFVDSSANNFAITSGGAPSQGAFSPFSNNGWSTNFNSSQYVTTPANTAYDIVGGDFTVECWINFTAYNAMGSTANQLVGTFTGGGGWLISINGVNTVSGIAFTSYTAGTGTTVTVSGISPTQMPLGVWHHVAVVKSGASLYFYLNGINYGGAQTAVSAAAGNALAVGVYQQNLSYAGNPNWNLSNMRIVKGTAVYTTNFSVPTAKLTAISGTSFLAFQDSRIKDNSTIAALFTVSGAPSVQAKSTFAVNSVYSADTHGASLYFNGTTDYITSAASSAYAFGTGDFTIEGWVYMTSFNSTANGVFQQGTSNFPSSTVNSVAFGTTGSTAWQIYSNNGNYTTTGIAAVTPVLNQWIHFAVVKASSVIKLYINGILGLSTPDGTNYTGTFFGVGSIYGTPSTDTFPGYISNLRVIKGTAVYTSAFTPPTAQLTAVTNTQLLLLGKTSGVSDTAGNNDVVLYGNAQVSSFSKVGSGSIALNGSTDYAVLPPQQTLQLGAGDFTIEFWMYLNALPSAYTRVFSISNTSVAGQGDEGLVIEIASNNVMTSTFISGTTSYGSVTDPVAITAGAWIHWAYTRNGTTSRLFRNGVLVATGNAGTAYVNWAATWKGYIGAWLGTSRFVNGYIDDLRITKGVCRYTGNFAVPTAAFPTN
jgi:hypothetical protein